MTYFERLKVIREDNGLKKSEVAKILNIKQHTYSNYENGLNKLPLKHLIKLCEFYNVSANYFLGLPENLEYPEK